jgi:UDP-3-O-[3-hydroxymyristoyl] N-acetylglucosamine deacetylase/3-hydroxyacyl-[acyl-carrier-protein] dehydratase
MIEKQMTLKEAFSFSGKGLHTGKNVNMKFCPAKENSGYQFRRTDLEGAPTILARADKVIDTARGTTIGNKDFHISTIEHALAALYATGVDNCMIEINAEEVPIMEGSAKLFVDAINNVGLEEQNAYRKYFKPRKKIRLKEGEHLIEILPDEDFSVNTFLSFPESTLLKNQFAALEKLEDFEKEIAPCKTFVFLREVEHLYNNNLVKGGTLDNALVIVDRVIPQEDLDRLADLFQQPHMKIEKQGILNNTEMSFDNEPARHKILDLIGDLALLGYRIKGRIAATRPGHKLNTDFAKILLKEVRKPEYQAPEYDLSLEPLMNIEDIRKLLPHRPPFLLVDKILHRKENKIIGLKNVTMNEPYFVGHFPDEPIMPGVLIVEAMAQTGGLLVLSDVDDPEKYSTYFLKIDNVKFRQKVVPGDTIIFRLTLTSPVRRGCAYMRGEAFVNDTLVTEAEFMAQIVKTKEPNIIE